MSLFGTTVLEVAGVGPESGSASACRTRQSVFEMTQAAENAVLRPHDPGGLPKALRAALAARVARTAGEDALAERYAADAGDHAGLATGTGEGSNAARIVAFTDKAAGRTRDIAAEDIEALKADGMTDADIVRLCELIAFVAYQARVVAGLRLMGGVA